MAERSGWTLNRLVVLVILGGFALLLIEVRYLHDEVLRNHTVAWAPIVYSGVMSAAIVVCLLSWNHGGRRVLFWMFAAGLVIGPVGFWFHNSGRPWRGVKQEMVALARPVGHAKGDAKHEEPKSNQRGENQSGGEPKAKDSGNAEQSKESGAGHEHAAQHEEEGGGPPALAPLSIFGLGLLGMLACARRLQPAPRLE